MFARSAPLLAATLAGLALPAVAQDAPLDPQPVLEAPAEAPPPPPEPAPAPPPEAAPVEAAPAPEAAAAEAPPPPETTAASVPAPEAASAATPPPPETAAAPPAASAPAPETAVAAAPLPPAPAPAAPAPETVAAATPPPAQPTGIAEAPTAQRAIPAAPPPSPFTPDQRTGWLGQCRNAFLQRGASLGGSAGQPDACEMQLLQFERSYVPSADGAPPVIQVRIPITRAPVPPGADGPVDGDLE